MAENKCGSVAQLTDLPDDISVSYIKDVEISLKARQQGYRYFSEGYFDNVKFFKGRDNYGEIQVSAKCHRSMRKNEKPHLINIDISPRKVELAHCSCTAGASGCCSHVIGLLLGLQHWQLMGLSDVPCELSCTSLPQQWNVPRGSKIESAPAPDIVIVKPKPNRKRKPVRNKLTECRKIRVQDTDMEHLKSLDLPISYLVTVTSTKINTHLGEFSIGSGLSTHAAFYADQTPGKPVETNCGNLQFPKPVHIPLPAEVTIPDNIIINEKEAQNIEESTRDQASSQRWHDERENRITASKFHDVIKRRTWTEGFLLSITKGRAVNTAATSYGRCNEEKARQEYVKRMGHHVHECGFVVNPKFPFIGATPDGKVCDDGECGILEIKCPYSARDMNMIEATTLPSFCLSEDLSLKSSHHFYCQVQGQLLVTGAPFCDFVVYTKKDFHVERIMPDSEYMEELLHKLSNVYFQHIYKYVFSKPL